MIKKKVLLLTAPYGNGHLQPARVLKQQLEEKGMEVQVYDIIDEWNTQISKITQNVYKQMYRVGFRRIYQFWYWATDQKIAGSIVTSFLKTTNRKNLKNAIHTINPDSIICVFPSWALYKLLEDFEITVPVQTVVTDFYMHKLWYHPDVTRYFVANEWTYQSTNFPVDEKKFFVSGIPIKPEFEDVIQEVASDQEIKRTVLLIAGASGVSTQYLALAKKIHGLDENLKVILICGKNRALFAKSIKARKKLASPRFVVIGFSRDMLKQYQLADVVITKSGGNTVTELAALAKPAIFFDPLFGQEMANAQFFEKYGVAKIAMTAGETVSFVEQLYENETAILDMKCGYKEFFVHDSGKKIADEIERLMK
ncbi:processive diacylglycerol beta-glucosyltransferase [Erysipelotrichaceae bacterium]|nr:processive diacylglycerol beta-glucosyltransferase [Erysipelotrichaceae bacterium]